MTKDLEETLAELGAGYGSLVSRLKSAKEIDPSGTRVFAPPRFWRYHRAALLAASLAIALAMTAMVMRDWNVSATSAPAEAFTVYTAAYASSEAALRMIVATQRGDGSWANDFLTRQNAAALAKAEGAEMRRAYKKAVRYLGTKGLRPFSHEEIESLRMKAKDRKTAT